MGGLTSEGVQSAGSLRIAYPFETVSNWVVWGTTLRGVDCSKIEESGNSMDLVGLYTGGTIRLDPEFKAWGVGLSSYRQHASCTRGVDGGAGGPDR